MLKNIISAPFPICLIKQAKCLITDEKCLCPSGTNVCLRQRNLNLFQILKKNWKKIATIITNAVSFGSFLSTQVVAYLKLKGDCMLKDAFTFEKLLTAHKKCRLSKQHKKETISFEINLSQNLTEMSKKLLNKTYKIGKYKQFYVYEPKKRNIEALSYKDRVVLMAFCMNVLEPKLEKKLIPDNVACRKNKGTLFGLDRLKLFLRKFYNLNKNNLGYFLKCDIKKYFQNISQEILREQLAKVLDEEDLWFVDILLQSRNAETGVGLPIGNQTSQWFALFYLNGLDHFIKEKLRIKYYVRYMDDMILLHKDKEYLDYCKNEIKNYCSEKLYLELNAKTQIGKLSNGIDFLGFRTILNENGKIIRLLRSQAKLRLRRKIKHLYIFKTQNLVDDKYVDVRINAYNAHLCHSNAINLLFKYIKRFKK